MTNHFGATAGNDGMRRIPLLIIAGRPEAAPFDRIILTCGCDRIPDILLQQLKIGGIMVAPEGHGKSQQLVVVTRFETGFERVLLMPVTFVPLIGED